MSDLYREQLMEHYKEPQNKGRLVSPTISVHETNPFCGDSLDLDLTIKDSIIEEIGFEGEACAVGIASASLFTEELKGKTMEEVKKYSKEDILELVGVELTTSRVKCATLVLEALQKGIKEYETE